MNTLKTIARYLDFLPNQKRNISAVLLFISLFLKNFDIELDVEGTTNGIIEVAGYIGLAIGVVMAKLRPFIANDEQI